MLDGQVAGACVVVGRVVVVVVTVVVARTKKYVRCYPYHTKFLNVVFDQKITIIEVLSRFSEAGSKQR